MDSFLGKHKERILGVVSTFDRILLKGHLMRLTYPNGMRSFLSSQDIYLKDFSTEMPKISTRLKKRAEEIARQAGRPLEYLQGSLTRAATGETKEMKARQIAERDGITEGLVCIFYIVEPCRSYKVITNNGKIHLAGAGRKCLHFYYYYLDPEFGLMHIRLQGWAPFQIQFWINGREWLARQLDKAGIKYHRETNCFTWIENLEEAQRLCTKFTHRDWPKVLGVMANRVNPYLRTIKNAGFGDYYWCIDQAEFATDIMFKNRSSLEAIYHPMVDVAMKAFDAEDIMKFLGRKLWHNFKGEVITDKKIRPEGKRVKHRLKRNTLKMYDKASVIRVETTVNNPNEFKVLKKADGELRWFPMAKGIANFWRYAEVSLQANSRYLEALTEAEPREGEVIQELDDLCRSRKKDGKRVARFNPLSEADGKLFAAVMSGEHCISGFRNMDLQRQIFDEPARNLKEALRRSRRVTRLIVKLRGHGLVSKVRKSRLYRITKKGFRLLGAVVLIRRDFQRAIQLVA